MNTTFESNQAAQQLLLYWSALGTFINMVKLQQRKIQKSLQVELETQRNFPERLFIDRAKWFSPVLIFLGIQNMKVAEEQ